RPVRPQLLGGGGAERRGRHARRHGRRPQAPAAHLRPVGDLALRGSRRRLGDVRRLRPGRGHGREGLLDLRGLPSDARPHARRVLLPHDGGAAAEHALQPALLRPELGLLMRRPMRFDRRQYPAGVRWTAAGLPVLAGGLLILLGGCGQKGSLTDDRSTIVDRDLSAVAGPVDPSKLKPVERVPRNAFGVVNPAPLSERDTPAFVYPSLDSDERASLLEGLTFFTTEHTAAE